jgi:hypothetical protein
VWGPFRGPTPPRPGPTPGRGSTLVYYYYLVCKFHVLNLTCCHIFCSEGCKHLSLCNRQPPQAICIVHVWAYTTPTPLTQPHVKCKARPAIRLKKFRTKTSILTCAPPSTSGTLAPWSVLPLSQESLCVPQVRRQDRAPRGFSNPTALGLPSPQVLGPAAVRLSDLLFLFNQSGA